MMMSGSKSKLYTARACWLVLAGYQRTSKSWWHHFSLNLWHCSKNSWNKFHAPAKAAVSNFGTGGGCLKDLCTTYVTYQSPEAMDEAGWALSPPPLMFLHPGRPGFGRRMDFLKSPSNIFVHAHGILKNIYHISELPGRKQGCILYVNVHVRF